MTSWAQRRTVVKKLAVASTPACICFAPENHKDYVHLAMGFQDGSVVIYKIYQRTMQAEICGHLVGHTQAITTLFFILGGDELVTTCMDKSLIVWHVSSGKQLKVFSDASPLLCAAPHPLSPDALVVSTASRVLRVVTMSGVKTQTLKMESCVQVLTFDHGARLFLGTESGTLHALEGNCSDTLEKSSKHMQFDSGAITSIVCAPARYGRPAYLLVSTSDDVKIVDYSLRNGLLTEFVVRYNVQVASLHSPSASCYAPSDQGFLVSGSRDGNISICALSKNSKCHVQRLGHHEVPVVAVAVSSLETVLVSADSDGHVVLWSRELEAEHDDNVDVREQLNEEDDAEEAGDEELAPLPPASLCWDWPLSRQERKSRISLLDRQMSNMDRKNLKQEVAVLRKSIRRLTVGGC